jgi:hypothetical protein
MIEIAHINRQRHGSRTNHGLQQTHVALLISTVSQIREQVIRSGIHRRASL